MLCLTCANRFREFDSLPTLLWCDRCGTLGFRHDDAPLMTVAPLLVAYGREFATQLHARPYLHTAAELFERSKIGECVAIPASRRTL